MNGDIQGTGTLRIGIILCRPTRTFGSLHQTALLFCWGLKHHPFSWIYLLLYQGSPITLWDNWGSWCLDQIPSQLVTSDTCAEVRTLGVSGSHRLETLDPVQIAGYHQDIIPSHLTNRCRKICITGAYTGPDGEKFLWCSALGRNKCVAIPPITKLWLIVVSYTFDLACCSKMHSASPARIFLAIAYIFGQWSDFDHWLSYLASSGDSKFPPATLYLIW